MGQGTFALGRRVPGGARDQDTEQHGRFTTSGQMGTLFGSAYGDRQFSQLSLGEGRGCGQVVSHGVTGQQRGTPDSRQSQADTRGGRTPLTAGRENYVVTPEKLNSECRLLEGSSGPGAFGSQEEC